MPILEQLGMQAAETTQNAILGMIAGGFNDTRQLKQQGRLNEQQYAIDGRALARQKAADLEFWKATSYPGQIAMMKEANLSPGLAYGMAGGGGASIGSSATTNAAKAPAGGNEVLGMQLIAAQRDLLKAQTAKTEAEAVKTAGVDTTLTEAQGRLAKNVAQFYVDTYQDNYGKVKAELEILENQAKTSHETQSTDVKIKEAELVGLGIANELKRAQTDLTEEQMKATVEAVKQKWQEVSIKQGHLDLDKFIQDVKESTKLTTQAIIKVIGLLR